ncbi:unnamed protein product, partial [Meganyctiphanes norvegica]
SILKVRAEVHQVSSECSIYPCCEFTSAAPHSQQSSTVIKDMEVTMDMDKFILLATLIPLVLATALAFAIVALCFCYCKLRDLREKSEVSHLAEDISKVAVGTTTHLSHPPTVSQNIQSETSMSKDVQFYSLPVSENHLLPYNYI